MMSGYAGLGIGQMAMHSTAYHLECTELRQQFGSSVTESGISRFHRKRCLDLSMEALNAVLKACLVQRCLLGSGMPHNVERS